MKKIYCLAAVMFFIASVAILRIISIINNDEVYSAASTNGTYTIKAVAKYADIYDCNMNLLVNCSEKYNAVIIPNHISSIQLQPYIIDTEAYLNGIKGKMPFLCEVTKDAAEQCTEAIIFKSSVRNDHNQIAPHIIGYTLNNNGVCGIEKSYNDFLREEYALNKVTFQVNALGEVLHGLKSETTYPVISDAGIITTLDKNIQQICENVFDDNNVKKGAIVVMDIKTGEIKASVSYPDFDITKLDEAVDDLSSPFLNRAFSAYSVGSIFKLVTSAAALEQGISSEFSYTCTGSIDVNGQVFNCHKWGGHGEINMNEAIVHSCNTYFIALSEYLDKEQFIETAKKLGFGEELVLCDDIVSASGNLQTKNDINVPAELANMSFGQGKLTATPVQICRMTSAIANNGVIKYPTLIKGIKYNDGTIEYNKTNLGMNVLSHKTAVALKAYMRNVVIADNSMSAPNETTAAGKTSTAQTGWFDENGNEMYNCWFTGFFPSYNPEYAVTILIEGGVSGNRDAGPVFKAIADDITEYKKSLR
mgnify:FL=1